MEENIKRCWKEASFRGTESYDPDNRRYTALQSLTRRYKHFSNLGLLLLIMMPLCLFNIFSTNGIEKLWISIATISFAAIYCATASIMDRWLYNGIKSIDIAKMSVSEVCRLAYYYRKKHLQFIAILLPMAILLIGSMAYIFSAEKYILTGLIVGFILGVALGSRQLLAFLSEYRDITKE